jgi:C4-dicarboxylate transporter DctM subunit
MTSSLSLSANGTRTERRTRLAAADLAVRRGEESVAAAALIAMVLLPLAEMVVRAVFVTGIPGAGPAVQHLTLWVGFLGASLAARDDRLLSIATGTLLPVAARRWTAVFVALVAVAVTTALCWGAWELVRTQRDMGSIIALHVPVWPTQVVMPVALGSIAVRLALRASPSWPGRVIAALGIPLGALLVWQPAILAGAATWCAVALVIAAGLLGAPIFVVLGGAAVVLFLAAGSAPVAVLIETYALAVSPTLAAIPLFTLAGFVLAESRASDRLLRLFHAWFGWIPGGTAVVCALLCSFFTVFTGGSGVTILALGGLLFPALLRDGYRDRFALGLLTASGSLGLLLPPAMPLIVYGVIAMIPIEDLFIGGLLPGLLLTGMVAAWGIREGVIRRSPRRPFRGRVAAAALWEAKWEAAMPVVVLVSIFSGWATPIEAAAVAACYALVTQVAVHREVSVVRDLPRVLSSCVALVGGVLIILSVAVGLTSYLITTDAPGQLLQWTQLHIGSRVLFLLALNGFLLIVGCLMDIFSATVVVVPLLVPLGLAYGVHPVHLAMIFMANLELGYLTPPVGLNLFLASYRFDRPLAEVFRASVPFLIILGIGVLLITYVPWLTTGLLALRGR